VFYNPGKVKMKRILKMMTDLPKEALEKIIDQESARVNELNRRILGAGPVEGGED
jgi:hypothetical protein